MRMRVLRIHEDLRLRNLPFEIELNQIHILAVVALC